MSADQFVLLFGCLFGRDLPGAGQMAGQPAPLPEAPPQLAPAPAGPASMALPPVKFGAASSANTAISASEEKNSTPLSTFAPPSPSTPPAATPVTLPQRPVQLYAVAGTTHIAYAGAASASTWRSFTLGAVAPLRRSATLPSLTGA